MPCITKGCPIVESGLESSLKKTTLFWGVVGLPFLVSTAACSQASPGATEKAITALENQWAQAQRTNNPDLAAPLLADNFVQTSGAGEVTTSKAAALATAKAEKFSSMEYIDLKVYAFGNTAVAIGGFHATGIDASGKAFDETGRFTDTWTKTPSGKWLCVASQDALAVK
jgi:ketosteroid isomerase-like protein